MASLNRVILIGRLVRDPELKKTTSGLSVTSFTVAVDNVVKSGSEKTTSFISCTAWNKTAEFIAKYCVKGSLVCVDGRLVQRNYTDKNNNKRFTLEVIVENVQSLERKISDSSNESSLTNDTDLEDNVSIQEGIDAEDDDLPF